MDSHEEDDVVFDFHEVGDESDSDPEEENGRDIECGNDEPESEKSGSPRTFSQNDDDIGKYDGNDPEQIENQLNRDFVLHLHSVIINIGGPRY